VRLLGDSAAIFRRLLSNCTMHDHPHFYIIGAAKSGTTTLCNDLGMHPKIFMPDDKEPDILHRCKGDLKRARQLYTRLFAQARSDQFCADGSTFYAMVPEFPDVASLARDLSGEGAKIIYILRDPVARIESHIAHDAAVGRIDAVNIDKLALSEPRYASWSDYPAQISHWSKAFGSGNILLIRFEHFIANRAATVREVTDFLGLDAAQLVQSGQTLNARGSQLQVKSSFLSGLINSTLYRTLVRSMLPQVLRDWLKRSATNAVDVSSIRLGELTRAALRDRFADQDAVLAASGIRVIG
jgi:Sulfotransferase domain